MICGDGVGLRLLLEDDLRLLSQWRDDEQTRAMFYSPAFISDTGLRHWFKALLGDPTRMWFMLQRLEDGATIGIVGLERIDYRNQIAELAGLIIAPTERKQGWGTKTLDVLIRYSFDDLNLHRLYARIYASNHAALCVAEKAGLKDEGVERQSTFHDWKYEDITHMAILREEWKHESAPTTID